MVKTYVVDGIEYTASNRRMRYNPEYHENHGKRFTEEDLAYMCAVYDSGTKRDIALALGRTESTVLAKAYELRKKGLFDKYKAMGKWDD